MRNELKKRVRDTVGEIVEIKGLARFLPSDSFTVQGEGDAARPDRRRFRRRERNGPGRPKFKLAAQAGAP